MKQETKKSKYANIYLHILGYLICIIPPLGCTLSYFPVWERSEGFKLHALCVILIILAVFPAMRLVKRAISSDASYILWLLLFILFYSLSKIADQMTIISFIGFISFRVRCSNILHVLCTIIVISY